MYNRLNSVLGLIRVHALDSIFVTGWQNYETENPQAELRLGNTGMTSKCADRAKVWYGTEHWLGLRAPLEAF